MRVLWLNILYNIINKKLFENWVLNELSQNIRRIQIIFINIIWFMRISRINNDS